RRQLLPEHPGRGREISQSLLLHGVSDAAAVRERKMAGAAGAVSHAERNSLRSGDRDALSVAAAVADDSADSGAHELRRVRDPGMEILGTADTTVLRRS